MKQTDRKSVPFRQLTRAGYFYQGPLPAGGFEWRYDLRVGPEVEGLERAALTPPWLVGPFRGGLAEPEANVLKTPKGNPGLHRIFAHLWSEESILSFADTYGHLLPVSEVAWLVTGAGQGFEFGESLAQWRREIAACRRLLYFWDHAQNRDSRVLAGYVRWHAADNLAIQWGEDADGKFWPLNGHRPGSGVGGRGLLIPGRPSSLAGRWRLGEVIEPMRFFVHVEVNRRLKGVSPHVLPYAPAANRITFIPDSLRSALYVLFALELAGETRTKVCGNEKCLRPGRLFTPNTRRNEYCSDACRKQAYDLLRRGKKAK